MRVKTSSARSKTRFFTLKDILIVLLTSIFTAEVILNVQLFQQPPPSSDENPSRKNDAIAKPNLDLAVATGTKARLAKDDGSTATTSTSILAGARILVAIVAYDFSQAPHLEEVLSQRNVQLHGR